jgi:hypothetical protein
MKVAIVAAFLILGCGAYVLADDQVPSDMTAPSSTTGAEVENCAGCTGQVTGNPVDLNQDPNSGVANGSNGATTSSPVPTAPTPTTPATPSGLGTQSDLSTVPGVIVPGVISDFKPAKLGGNSPLGGLNGTSPLGGLNH